MNLLNLIFYIRGTVNIKISGRFPERFINMCIMKNIYIWNIEKRGTSVFTATVSKKAFSMLDEICEKTKTEIDVLNEHGIQLLKLKLLRRHSFVIGFFIFLFLSLWMFSHVWHIEVKNSKYVPKERILAELEDAGIKYGALKYKIDPDKVQTAVLSREKDLAWLWAEVRGTGVYVDLRDRVKKPEIIDINSPCNLIASDNGFITSVLVTEGRGVVTKDMYVSKGQLLVGGLMDNSAVGVRYVHSDGEIFADVTMSLSEAVPLEKEIKEKTGKKKTEFILNTGNRSLTLFKYKKSSEYICETKNYPLKIGDIYFPFSVSQNTYFEAEIKKVKEDEKKIIKKTQEKLEKDLQKSLKNGMILEKEFFTQKNGNNITVTLRAKCNKQIAIKQPIEEDVNGTEDD